MRKLRNTYYVLRHGQTIYQTRKLAWMYPKIDSKRVKLTKKGEKQIKLVTKKLKRLKIDLIFSSDFFRTRQTAKIVSRALAPKKVVFDKRLRDINLGVYMGGKKGSFYEHFPKKSKVRFTKTPHRGESWLQCQRRIVGFLKKIDRKHKNKKVLIISHGDSLWLLEGRIKNWSQDKLLKEKKMSYINTGELRKLYGT
ncbi:MAG: putative phosphoglycerate mutase [Parcubacteria group bacterium Gr01-1014_30]|nr:MAG: putative phosphoglycerate mutase [Parcubacteria group bacterium Gr01-1014_30]